MLQTTTRCLGCRLLETRGNTECDETSKGGQMKSVSYSEGNPGQWVKRLVEAIFQRLVKKKKKKY